MQQHAIKRKTNTSGLALLIKMALRLKDRVNKYNHYTSTATRGGYNTDTTNTSTANIRDTCTTKLKLQNKKKTPNS